MKLDIRTLTTLWSRKQLDDTNHNFKQLKENIGTVDENAVGSEQLKEDSVGTVELKDKAVTGDKVADKSISRDKLQIGSVSRDRTDYLEPQFHNLATVKNAGFYYPNGDRVNDLTKATTDILEGVENTSLKTNCNARLFCWADGYKKIGGYDINANTIFKLLPTTKYYRLGFDSVVLESFGLINGNEEFVYSDLKQLIVNQNQLKDSIVEPQKTTYLKKVNNNIFNKESFIDSFCFNLNGLPIITNPLMGSFEFDVKPNEEYECYYVGYALGDNARTFVTFWSDDSFISSEQTQHFKVPNDPKIKKCRIAISPEGVAPPEVYLKNNKVNFENQESIVIEASQVKNMPNNKVYFSVVGDSIQTMKGVIPAGNNPFYPKSDVLEWDDTCMGMLENNKFNLKLLVNNSWSGSWVSTGKGNGGPHSSGTMACKFLGKNGNNPDIIFLTKGTNDFGGNVSLVDFKKEYTIMIDNAKNKYPKAKIFCLGMLWKKDQINTDGISIIEYIKIIKELSELKNCTFIDLFEIGINLENYSDYLIDGLHPKKAGHRLMFKKIKVDVYDYA